MKVHSPNDTNFDDHTPVYSLMNPMISNIFKFNLIAHNLDVKTFLQGKWILPHNCESFDFMDKGHQHIATDDLWIIKR